MAAALEGPIPGKDWRLPASAELILMEPGADSSALAWAGGAEGAAPSAEKITKGVMLARVAGPIPETASRSERDLNGPFWLRC